MARALREPATRLLICILLEALSYGMLTSISVIYFTRHVGISAHSISLAILLSGAIALSAALPFGVLSDRVGANRLLVVSLVIHATAIASFAVANDLRSFTLSTAVMVVSERAAYAARGAIMGRSFKGKAGVLFRSRARVVMNVALAAGAAIGAVALHADSTQAYVVVILGSALVSLTGAIVSVSLPKAVPAKNTVQPRSGATFRVVRDRHFVLLTMLSMLLSLHVAVIDIALPLQIVEASQLPRWMASGILIVNVCLVVAMQVRLGSKIEDIPSAFRAMVLSAGLLAVAFIMFSGISSGAAWMAWLAALAGIGVYTAAEIFESAGSWTLSFELAPSDAHGEYQSFFGMGTAAAGYLAPMVVVAIVVERGALGWYLLSGCFVIVGMAIAVGGRSWSPAEQIGDRYEGGYGVGN